MHKRNYPAKAKYDIIAPVLDGNLSIQAVMGQNGLSRRTLERWIKAFHNLGIEGLCPKKRHDCSMARVKNREWRTLAKALALSRPAYTIKHIHQWLLAQAHRRILPTPAYHTVCRWYHQIDPALLTMAKKGTKAYQHQHELVHRWESEASNALWQADHTLLDIWLQDGNGSRKRPWLTLIVDDCSRAISGYFLSFDHPNALHTALALRHAICPKAQPDWPVCGLPDRLYTDRGKDFLSDHLEEVCLRLHIAVVRAQPRQPRGKGKIERLFHSINQGLLRQLPGYTKGPAGQVASLLTLTQFEQQLEAFILRYHQTPHQTTRLAPAQRWGESGFLPQLPTYWDALDGLLMTISKPRKVQRDGIQFRGFRYLSATLAAYVGESVTIRYDPRYLAEIRVYYKDEYIGKALCQALTGQVLSLKTIETSRKRVRRERRALIDQAKQAVTQAENTPLSSSLVETSLPATDQLPLNEPIASEISERIHPSTSLKLYHYGHRS